MLVDRCFPRRWSSTSYYRMEIYRVLLGKIPAVIFPPWWAVPVLAVIFRHILALPGTAKIGTAIFHYCEKITVIFHYCEKITAIFRSTGNRRKSTTILEYRQKSTAILEYYQKRNKK